MKIVIFGVGEYYRKNKNKIPQDVEIVAFIDNNSVLWGTYIDEVRVYAPENIETMEYDVIILSSAMAGEMKTQMVDLGVAEEQLLNWGELYRRIAPYDYMVYEGNPSVETKKKKILIISTNLTYGGATIAAIYAARALQGRNISVVLSAPWGDQRLIEEVTAEGITVVIYPVLPYIDAEKLEKINGFDMVIVNVFRMIQCACEISKVQPVLWWIHENSVEYDKEYPNAQVMFDSYHSLEQMKNVNIAGVSTIALNNFNYYYPNRMRRVLPYGIPDLKEYEYCVDKKDNMIFAIVGLISLRKAQNIFIEAIKQLCDSDREISEFWIIGRSVENDYYQQVRAAAADIPQIKFVGEMTREEIHSAYQEIDVVVCASLEETMSLTITEGMMYEKICITTEATGMAGYITNGENGFICKANDASDLKDKMSFVIKNKDKMSNIRMNARKTYEKYFTLEAFGERLEAEINKTIDEFDSVVERMPQ